MLSMLVGSPQRTLFCVILATAMAGRGYFRKSLTTSGALAAFVVGFLTVFSSTRNGVMLICFYLTSTKLTRVGAARKKQLEGSYFLPGGQRDHVQVLANSFGALVCGVAHLCTAEYPGQDGGMVRADTLSGLLFLGMLGHWTCCAADTWSSELGMLSKSRPVLITNCQKCPAGTNGGVTLLGTMGAIGGGLTVGVVFSAAGYASGGDFQYGLVLYAGVMGLCGSMLDSVLGATMQESRMNVDEGVIVINEVRANVKAGPKSTVHVSGWDMLDNHQVNLLSSLVMTAVAPGMLYMLQR
jgi:uncharacterized protein (TIGR00297 family)